MSAKVVVSRTTNDWSTDLQILLSWRNTAKQANSVRKSFYCLHLES